MKTYVFEAIVASEHLAATEEITIRAESYSLALWELYYGKDQPVVFRATCISPVNPT